MDTSCTTWLIVGTSVDSWSAVAFNIVVSMKPMRCFVDVNRSRPPGL